MNTREIHAILEAVLANSELTAKTWALAQLHGTLHEIPSFQAYTALDEIGPANNWNGERGSALRLKERVDQEIVFPMGRLRRQLDAAVQQVVSNFKLT